MTGTAGGFSKGCNAFAVASVLEDGDTEIFTIRAGTVMARVSAGPIEGALGLLTPVIEVLEFEYPIAPPVENLG